MNEKKNQTVTFRRKISTFRIVSCSLLIILGMAAILRGWYIFNNIDIDKGGTIAFLGLIVLMIGIGTISYKYRLNVSEKQKMVKIEE